MAKITIIKPSGNDKVPPTFTVSGECDDDDGTSVTCKITKDSFSQSATGSVDRRKWSVTLGATNPIPVGTGYKIAANCPNEGTAVNDITVELRSEPGHGTSTRQTRE
jgi:hypothetical protein